MHPFDRLSTQVGGLALIYGGAVLSSSAALARLLVVTLVAAGLLVAATTGATKRHDAEQCQKPSRYAAVGAGLGLV